MTDTRPTFARLTEGRSGRSWKKAIPAVVVIVAFVALLAYLASAVSSSSQKAMQADRENQQLREQQTGMTQQIGNLQRDVAMARSPGRTTVILQNSEKKGKDGSWAAVTWGELLGGKSWMRVNAYGLDPKLEGKAYHLWFTPQNGAVADLGALDVDENGSGFLMNSALPAIDQGKSVLVSLDDQNSKQSGETIAKADLPALKPTMASAPPSAPAELPQAKPGEGTKPMHQLGK